MKIESGFQCFNRKAGYMSDMSAMMSAVVRACAIVMVARNVVVTAFRKVIGCTAVGIDIKSEPKMNKKGNPYYGVGVTKSVSIAGLVGSSYGFGVNNQLAREGQDMDFESRRPVWFQYISGSNIIGRNKNDPKGDDTDALYFAIRVLSASKPIYRTASGEVIATELIKPYLPIKVSPKTQDALVKKIIWRTIKFASIQSIRMGGKEFVITDGVSEVTGEVIATAQAAGEQEATTMAPAINEPSEIDED